MMKRFFYSSIIVFSLYLSISITHAIEQKPILLPTVKVMIYNLTSNNHVVLQGWGSGTIISPDGLIVTNNHVVSDDNDEPWEGFSICVVTDKQKKPDCIYTASLVARNKSLDVALLKINKQDIFHQGSSALTLPLFPYLDYKNSILPAIGEKIKAIGFPGIGGDTITETEGQVSGFEEREGAKNIKTDTVIAPGNSGGTAIDSKGKFMGLPTYGISDMNTLGYLVPLTEIEPWLQKIIIDPPQEHQFARELLDVLLLKEYETDQNRVYISDIFPFYRIEIPELWKVLLINDTNFILERDVKGNTVRINFSNSIFPYPLTEQFMQFLLKKIEKNKHEFINYTRTTLSFSGVPGYAISYDYGTYRYYYFFAPIENTLFSYTYKIPLENQEEALQVVENLMNNFTFVEGKNNTPINQQSYEQEYPHIKIQTFDDFYITHMYDSNQEEDIINIENPNSFEQNFSLSLQDLDKDLQGLSYEAILEEELKYQEGKLVNKYADIMMDGLSGFAYTHTYKGDDINQTQKETNIVVFLNNKKYFRFVYKDLENNYDKNIEKVIKTLKTFQYIGEENKDTKGKYNIPTFKIFYQDIKDHLYEKEINALASKDLFIKIEDQFHPDANMNRLQALEAILKSKIFIEQGRNLSETKKGIDTSDAVEIFNDTKVYADSVYKILSYSISKEIIMRRDNFYPSDGVTLAQALKMLCKTYEVPVWEPPYQITWHLPYMYKGLLLEVIPLELTRTLNPDKVLTRGEFSALLYNFVKVVGERSDL